MCHVDDAIASLRAVLDAAERRDPAAVNTVLKAAAANELHSAVRLVLPEIRHSIHAGDGRFTPSQVQHLESALQSARSVTRRAA